MKKDLSKTMAFLALVLVFLGIIFEGFTSTSSVDIGSGLLTSSLFFLVLGVAFIFAENKTVNHIGNGVIAIYAVTGVSALFSSSLSLTSINEIISLVTVILFIISTVYYVIRISLNYFGYTKIGFLTPSTNNNKMGHLRQWKKLADNNLIDESDYNKVKDLVLSNDPVVKDLNELRDLIAQGLAGKSDLDKVLK